jgi:histidinol-phosphate aminotransferase
MVTLAAVLFAHCGLAKDPFMNALLPEFKRRQFLKLAGYGALASVISPAFALQNMGLLPKASSVLALNYNENSLGMSPKALQAAIDAVRTYGNRYADGLIDLLKDDLVSQNNIELDQLILGNGSTQVIGAVLSAFAMSSDSKGTVVEPVPTFGDVRRYAKSLALKVVSVPVGGDFVTDVQALKDACAALKGPVLINLCNPNNPTGTIIDASIMSEWIDSAPDNYTFLVDEAYHEYALLNDRYASALPKIKEGRDNVIVTRTFSKIYGMAGMRIGYGIATAKTAAFINPFTSDFNLNAPGVVAATASLNDADFYIKSQSSNTQAKQILLDCLDELDLAYIPSSTNFVLHQITTPILDYQERMLAQKIKVGRKMTKEGWNRLSIGTPEEMTQFTQALKSFRQQGWI